MRVNRLGGGLGGPCSFKHRVVLHSNAENSIFFNPHIINVQNSVLMMLFLIIFCTSVLFRVGMFLLHLLMIESRTKS